MSKKLSPMVKEEFVFVKINTDNNEKETNVKRSTKKCGQTTTKTLPDVPVPKLRCHQIIIRIFHCFCIYM